MSEQQQSKMSKAAKNGAAGAQQKFKARKGSNGVLLKKYETVMCDMFSTSTGSNEICQETLHQLTPRYSKIPPFICDAEKRKLVDNARVYWKNRDLSTSNNADIFINGQTSPWPFDKETSLPQCGCVRGTDDHNTQNKLGKTKTGKDVGGVGDVKCNARASRKENQLVNMIQCVLALLPDDIRNSNATKANRTFRIVDFAGGTGHLAVPLALLLPQCEVVCVDLKKWSLDLLHRRVDGVSLSDDIHMLNNSAHKLPCQSNSIKVSNALPNLSTYHGSIQTYPHDFDIGVSLHACGEASDWVLRKCLEQNASWVVCSCCCGKIQQDAKNPYVYQSTGGNEKQIKYPQSKVFASLGGASTNNNQSMSAEMFDELARAADYSELGDLRKPKNACRRAAKSLVEWDRLLYTMECMQKEDSICCILTRMVPWESSPKNDILIGWFEDTCNPYREHKMNTSGGKLSLASLPEADTSCDVDFQVALRHLFGKHIKDNDYKLPIDSDQNDWTADEEVKMKLEMEQLLLNNGSQSYRFPTGMGARKRKLIHFVAENLGIRHWGEGRKDAEKTVVVARQRL